MADPSPSPMDAISSWAHQALALPRAGRTDRSPDGNVYRQRRLPECADKGRAMRSRFPALILATAFSLSHSVSGAAGGAAQNPGAAAIPRTPDGKPDLSGIWQVMNTAAWDIQDHPAQKGVPGGQGVVEGNDIPYQPGALQKKKRKSKTE